MSTVRSIRKFLKGIETKIFMESSIPNHVAREDEVILRIPLEKDDLNYQRFTSIYLKDLSREVFPRKEEIDNKIRTVYYVICHKNDAAEVVTGILGNYDFSAFLVDEVPLKDEKEFSTDPIGGDNDNILN
jgi:hypothetical protein